MLYRLFLVVLFTVAVPSYGQNAPVSDTPSDALASEAAVAAAALDARAWQQAIPPLERIVAANPTYQSVALEGSAAYWLGRSYAALERDNDAFATWRRGVLLLNEQQLFDARMSNALLWSIYNRQRTEDYRLGAEIFLTLLRYLDVAPEADVYPLMTPHLRGMQVVLPLALQEDIGLANWNGETPPPLTEDAGEQLAIWWRSQDVAVATPENERLQEHLARVAVARSTYAFDEGQDERGPIYIRLGPPVRDTQVRFDGSRFRQTVIERNLALNESEFYDNEFWVYEQIGPDAFFLFINRDGYYRVGNVRDLLPPAVRNGIGAGGRGQAKAKASIRTLSEIYTQLSLHHPAYMARATEAASFVSLLDDADVVTSAQNAADRMASEIAASGGNAGGLRDMTAGASATMPGGSLSTDRADLFVNSFLQQGQAEDKELSIRREENVPLSNTNQFDDAEPLAAAVRYARFLDDDGTTRTEIYWGVPPGRLQPSKDMRRSLDREGFGDDYLLIASTVQRASDYTTRVIDRRRHMVRDLNEDPQSSIAPSTYTLRGDTTLYHVAVQWDQYAALTRTDGSPYEVGPRVKVNAFRADSLQALPNDGRTLTMSDLKPMVLGEDGLLAQDLLASAQPYPASGIPTTATLLLYFEAYHLTYDANDRTAYTVEYEVAQRETNRVRRLFGDGDVLTSASTAYEGTERTTRDYIVLDMADFEDSDDVTITVRLTDTTSGQQTERSISFDLRK